MLPSWLSGVLFVLYAFLDPEYNFRDGTYVVFCFVPFLLLAGVGTSLLIRVMKDNDHPFLEKAFLLMVLPFLGLAFLAFVVCKLIFRGI